MLVVHRANVVPLLIDRGLLSPETVVRRGVAVSEVRGRNRNFAVRWPGGGCFVKQQRRGVALGLRRELAVYRGAEGIAELEPFLPAVLDAAEDDDLLVFALVENPTSIAEMVRGERDFPTEAARWLGTALASCHRALGDRLRYGAADERAPFPARLPGMLHIDELDPYAPAQQSDAQSRLLIAVQREDAIVDGAAALRKTWQVNAVIHGDMKWHNCLLGNGAVILVDWEEADLGDAAWDVAGILQAYLGHWLWLVTEGKSLSADAGALLETLHASVNLFWSAYASALRLPPPARGAFLDRATALAAIRLLQSAYESLPESSVLTGVAVRFLQTAANILGDVPAARRELLGIAA